MQFILFSSSFLWFLFTLFSNKQSVFNKIKIYHTQALHSYVLTFIVMIPLLKFSFTQHLFCSNFLNILDLFAVSLNSIFYLITKSQWSIILTKDSQNLPESQFNDRIVILKFCFWFYWKPKLDIHGCLGLVVFQTCIKKYV